MALSDITLCLVTLSSEQSGWDRKQTSSQSMVIFPKSFYEKKSVWFRLSIKFLTQACIFSLNFMPFWKDQIRTKCSMGFKFFISFATNFDSQLIWFNDYLGTAHMLLYWFCIIFTDPTDSLQRESSARQNENKYGSEKYTIEPDSNYSNSH